MEVIGFNYITILHHNTTLKKFSILVFVIRTMNCDWMLF